MKDELFQELLESVKQGASIIKGKAQPSRSFAKAKRKSKATSSTKKQAAR